MPTLAASGRCTRRNDQTVTPNEDRWPSLPLAAWSDTYATLHMWTQIVGKIRLALAPHINHWWQVALYVTVRGLTTSPIAYGDGAFEIAFDFIDHQLVIDTSEGQRHTIALTPRPVADFYQQLMGALRELRIDVRIWPMAVEVPLPVRLDQDRQHASYDAEYAHRWWRILLQIDAVLKEFRARFLGKSSPVHFWWGSFDLAVTRFNGRRAFLQSTYEAGATFANWNREELEAPASAPKGI